jgi:hypothetical protein
VDKCCESTASVRWHGDPWVNLDGSRSHRVEDDLTVIKTCPRPLSVVSRARSPVTTPPPARRSGGEEHPYGAGRRRPNLCRPTRRRIPQLRVSAGNPHAAFEMEGAGNGVAVASRRARTGKLGQQTRRRLQGPPRQTSTLPRSPKTPGCVVFGLSDRTLCRMFCESHPLNRTTFALGR